MTSPSDALVLIGPMGAGKTSVGRRVAKALARPFFDTDIAVVREHGPIERIFAEHGEPHFRALERAAVREGLATGGVVSLGGGAVLDPETQADLAHAPRGAADGRRRGSSRAAYASRARPLLQTARTRSRAGPRSIAERRPDLRRGGRLTFDTSHGPLQHDRRCDRRLGAAHRTAGADA